MQPKRCKRCICDSSIKEIRFDERGICNYCKIHDSISLELSRGGRGIQNERFQRILRAIRHDAKSKRFGCVVGVSGGRDSTYTLYLAKKLGLKPVAVHFDNGWTSPIAEENIKKAVKKLDVPLMVVRYDQKKIYEAYKAVLDASVSDLCMVCNIGVLSSTYEAAERYGVRYILSGLSVLTEGINPVSYSYWDALYLGDILKKNARVKLKFRKTSLPELLEMTLFRGITTIPLPLYLKWNNAEIDRTLREELGWEYGGHHHFDCLYKPFVSYVLDKKFGIDMRRIVYSAQIRSNMMSHRKALEELAKKQPLNEEVYYCLDRLKMTKQDFRRMLLAPPKTFRDYKSHYPLIRFSKPVVASLVRMGLLSKTAYYKFYE